MAEERNLWHQLKRNTKPVVWTRIEATSGLGIPDLHGFYRRCFWLELKIIKNNKIKFSAHQILYHRNKAKRRCRVTRISLKLPLRNLSFSHALALIDLDE